MNLSALARDHVNNFRDISTPICKTEKSGRPVICQTEKSLVALAANDKHAL